MLWLQRDTFGTGTLNQVVSVHLRLGLREVSHDSVSVTDRQDSSEEQEYS